jgi:Ala-tRNA(Pro) deacylase
MDIFSFLDENGIRYQRFEHVAVFTCEESAKLPPMPGADTKNLFLRDKKGRRHFLVSVPHDKAVDLKALKVALKADNLSFASPERLLELLGVTPGSATLLGLVTDHAGAVEVVIDDGIWKQDAIQCHPLRNTATLVIPREDMEKFLQLTGHGAFQVMEVPGKKVEEV